MNTDYTVINLNDAKCTGISYHEANIFVTPAPTKYDIVSLNNKYCAGQNGVTLGLSGSENNVDYQLLRNGNPYGAVKPGTGSAIEWYNVINGTYTVNAINSLTTCEGLMNGSKTVILNPLPAAASITSNGICGTGNVLMNATLSGEGNQVEFSENGGTTVHSVVNYPNPYQYSTSTINAGSSKTIHVRTVVDSTGCASAWTNSALAIAIYQVQVEI